MPSMSYCMFGNTLLEMKQINRTMMEAKDFTSLDLNDDELYAYNKLVNQCKIFLNYHEDLMMGKEDPYCDDHDDIVSESMSDIR